jgi:hypothetical protein
MINRRDFLRLGSAFTGAAALSGLASSLKEATGQATSRPGVIIIVFDAMSATNLSLYGYPRKTTPSLERFAERATVYRQHYSAANFTTPGTATLLTGLYPWTHRAINEGGLIRRDLTKQNLFEAFGTDFHRLAFSQNFWPNYFIGQFQKDIDDFLAPAAFGFVEPTTGDIFRGDMVDGFRAFDDFLFKDGAPPGSLVFGTAEKARKNPTPAGSRWPRCSMDWNGQSRICAHRGWPTCTCCRRTLRTGQASSSGVNSKMDGSPPARAAIGWWTPARIIRTHH